MLDGSSGTGKGERDLVLLECETGLAGGGVKDSKSLFKFSIISISGGIEVSPFFVP
jgi:hypothetical protein